MLPNAITNTGPYAGFWRHLRTLAHALERAAEADRLAGGLTELDVDRLMTLAAFLRAALRPQWEAAEATRAFTSSSPRGATDYESGSQLRERISELPVFTDWQKTAKKGVDKKLLELIGAIESYTTSLPPTLIAPKFPPQEFLILHELLDGLLADAEIAMQESP